VSKKKYQVRIYPHAERDLKEIKDYFHESLKVSANRLFVKFSKKIKILEETPFLFPLLKDPYLHKLGYRFIPIDNYLIFYIVENKTVQIHRFLYGKRDYESLLK